MAAGRIHKAMVYLGLSDDDYDEYEDYEEPAPTQPPRRSVADQMDPAVGQQPGVRTLPRESMVADYSGPSTMVPRPAAVVRPISASQNARVHVVAPTQFGDIPQAADRLKGGQPVIVNLQGVNRELSRRIVDFVSGATYALGGRMDKVADLVFLLTPSNVEVSAEEKRRLEERGYRS